jgi:long-chain acyl-CoA synthetase
MKKWETCADIINQLNTYSNPKAFNAFTRGQWRAWSSEETAKAIRDLALGLVALGIQKGDFVGLMSSASPRWTIAQFAIQLAGGVLLPIFPNISQENFLLEVNETGLKYLFVDRTQPIPSLEHKPETLTHLIEMAEWITEPVDLTFDQLVARGAEVGLERPELCDQLMNAIRPDDLAAVIYSSATTGVPKGVMLTQRNLHAHMYDLPMVVNEQSRYLSLLPLAHIFGLCLNVLHVGYGASIYYFNDPKHLDKACQEVHPTTIAVVPRILEKIYGSMMAGLQRKSLFQRKLGQWAFDVAHHEEDTLFDPLVRPVVDKLVYSHIRRFLGGALNIVISGGAPLNPSLNNFYNRIGVPVYEGWGMTEACPITVNSPNNTKVGTVGKTFNGFKLKISSEGEVLVQGSGVMKGYYKRPELTAHALDSEGWLHTGDSGRIDSDGYLTIVGRIKELYKTSTGEYVAPVPIEQQICKAPLIDMAMVVAEGRKFVSAVLFPNQEILDSLKASHNSMHMTDEEFLNSSFVRKEMNKLFDELNKHLNHWEQVRAYCFVPHPPSIELGELTPSLKLRREVIMKKYAHLIDALYPQEALV